MPCRVWEDEVSSGTGRHVSIKRCIDLLLEKVVRGKFACLL